MKKQFNNKALWLSLLSLAILGIFILVGTGSSDLEIKVKKRNLGDGFWEETEFHRSNIQTRRYYGRKDKQGRWDGMIEITVYPGPSDENGYKETVLMQHGVRQGPGTRTYPDGHTETDIWHNGINFTGSKATNGITDDNSAFDILQHKYPWFLFMLNALNFDDVYVEAFLDTLETVLSTYTFDEEEFGDYYENVLDELSATPYDTIISFNSAFSMLYGLEEMKNAEFRLAVIDRYLSDGNSTYDVIKTKYPNYIISLSEAEISDEDFEAFCHDFDDTLALFKPLNPADTFFIDSLDSYIFYALFSFVDLEDSIDDDELSFRITIPVEKNDNYRSLYRKACSLFKPSSLKSTSAEVGEVVAALMFIQHYTQGDMIKRTVEEAWCINEDIITVPTAATEFSANVSATSVTLQGYVMEDGGDAVTSRGIVWATYYNPTLDDNIETSGTGTGKFTATLIGLTAETTYYARTFATNSAGTAYGNCIEFVAAEPSGIAENETLSQKLTVYPNPASGLTTFSFQLGSSESVMLTIMNMKGQQLLSKDLGRLPQGNYQTKLDLSGLENGMYVCRLSYGSTEVTSRFVVAR